MTAHDCFDPQSPGSLTSELALLLPQQPFEPTPFGIGDAQLATMEEVAFGNDADQGPFIIEDRQAALIGLEQEMERLQQRRFRLHGCKRPPHDI
jgi:hypothetical protein